MIRVAASRLPTATFGVDGGSLLLRLSARQAEDKAVALRSGGAFCPVRPLSAGPGEVKAVQSSPDGKRRCSKPSGKSLPGNPRRKGRALLQGHGSGQGPARTHWFQRKAQNINRYRRCALSVHAPLPAPLRALVTYSQVMTTPSLQVRIALPRCSLAVVVATA